MARYDVFIMNGANGATETLTMENTIALGGFFCYEDVAKMSFERGNVIARVYDNEKKDGFWLNNIEW